MIRLIIFTITAIGTVFFSSSQFTDPYFVPQWGILILGIILLVIVMAIHSIYPFDNYPSKPHHWIIVILVAIVGIEACYGLSNVFTIRTYGFTKITGTLDNTAGFAACLCAGFPFCLLLTTQKGWKRYLGSIVAITIIIATVLSLSRAGILSLLITFAVWIWKRLRIPVRIKWSFLLLASIFMTGLLYYLKKDSADGRLLIWKCSLNMIKDQPLSGWGIGGFEAHYMDYQAEYFKQNPDSKYTLLADTVQYPFNEYLNIGVTLGMLGIMAILIWLVYLWRVYIRHPNYEKECALLVWLSVGVFSAFSYPLMYPFVWLLLGYASVILLKDTWKLQPFFLKVTALCLLVSCLWMGNRTYRRIKAELLWAEAVENSSFGQIKQAMQKYQQVYPVLRKDRYFMYNYAMELNRHGMNDDALRVAKECRSLWADYDLELLLGNLYEQMNEESQAKEHYIKASQMCPNRFVPLYQLVLLLDKNGQKDEAFQIAQHIIEKPVKVPSYQVNRIKKEMNDYIIRRE